jgi:hypothetical protein
VKSAEWEIATRELSIKSAVYNPTSDSVTLTLGKKVRKYPAFMIMDRQSADELKHAVQLASQHTTPSPGQLLPQISPITDLTGNPLDSTHSGTPNGSLVALVAVGKAGRKART